MPNSTKPSIALERVGCFFTDNRRNFSMGTNRPDVGAYLRLPRKAKPVQFDLSAGFNSNQFDHHEDHNDECLLVEKFLEREAHLLNDVRFVTRRGLITKIMSLDNDGYMFSAKKKDGVIYLSDVREDVRTKPTSTIRLYEGRKFEQYIFAGKYALSSQAASVGVTQHFLYRYPQQWAEYGCNGEQ